ncbi:hypothetical protein E2320_012768, partial [Naja naja]
MQATAQTEAVIQSEAAENSRRDTAVTEDAEKWHLGRCGSTGIRGVQDR